MALTFDNEVAMTFVVGVSFAFFPAALMIEYIDDREVTLRFY